MNDEHGLVLVNSYSMHRPKNILSGASLTSCNGTIFRTSIPNKGSSHLEYICLTIPTAFSAWAFPLGYLGDDMYMCVKFQDLENSSKSSLMKQVALSVTKVMGTPESEKIVLNTVITEFAASDR